MNFKNATNKTDLTRATFSEKTSALLVAAVAAFDALVEFNANSKSEGVLHSKIASQSMAYCASELAEDAHDLQTILRAYAVAANGVNTAYGILDNINSHFPDAHSRTMSALKAYDAAALAALQSGEHLNSVMVMSRDSVDSCAQLAQEHADEVADNLRQRLCDEDATDAELFALQNASSKCDEDAADLDALRKKYHADGLRVRAAVTAARRIMAKRLHAAAVDTYNRRYESWKRADEVADSIAHLNNIDSRRLAGYAADAKCDMDDAAANVADALGALDRATKYNREAVANLKKNNIDQ